MYIVAKFFLFVELTQDLQLKRKNPNNKLKINKIFTIKIIKSEKFELSKYIDIKLCKLTI